MKFELFRWLESGFVNLTFTNDEIDCDIEEIRGLLDDGSDI